MGSMTTFTRKSRRVSMIAALDGHIDRDEMTALRDRLAPLVPFARDPGVAEDVERNGLPAILLHVEGRRHCLSADSILKGSSTALAHSCDGSTRMIVLERTPHPKHCSSFVQWAHMLSITALAHDALDHLLDGHGMPLDLLRSAAAAAAVDARRAEGVTEALSFELTLHSPVRRWTTNPIIARSDDDEPLRSPEAHDELIRQEVPFVSVSLIDDRLHLRPVRGETNPADDPIVVMRRMQDLRTVHACARRHGMMI